MEFMQRLAVPVPRPRLYSVALLLDAAEGRLCHTESREM
jgi:hypothetical protein